MSEPGKPCLRCGEAMAAHCRADGATPGGRCAGFVDAWDAEESKSLAPPQPVPLTVPDKG